VYDFDCFYCCNNALYDRAVHFSYEASYSSNYIDQSNLSFMLLCHGLVDFHTEGMKYSHVSYIIILSTEGSIQANATTNT
jgi:hypothetical protein